MLRLAALIASVAATLIGSVAVSAATDPYPGGAAGYDAASGQCGAAPPASQFAIIDATGGRPFTANACLASEVTAAAGRQISFYLNTGYAGAYLHDITADCRTAPPQYSGKAAQAYEIGCSEASYAAARVSGVVPAMWWLDVESANSWSSSSTAYNAATIQGAIDKARTSGSQSGAAGVYSTPGSWSAIVGASPVSIDASWVYAGYGYSCPGTAFGAPIWVLQGGQVSSGGAAFDTDTAC